MTRQSQAHLWFIIALTFSNLFIWYAVISQERGGNLTVAFLDVGQGDSIFVETPNGVQAIIDGGPNSKMLNELGRFMSAFDRRVDVIFVTNPDKDHYAGFIDLLKTFEVASVVLSSTKSETETFARFSHEVENEDSKRSLAMRGQRFVLDPEWGVYLDILFPDRDVSGLSSNDGSIISRLSFGNVCFILTGDAPVAIEKYLVSLDERSLDCQVLKAGHHGSRTSTSPEFVSAVSPEYAVISSGAGNKYGHPHKETLETLEKFGVKILRTDEKGSVVFKTDGNSFLYK